MVPSVKGACGSPWILVALPSSTVTSMAQVSGQSCGHATRTVSLMRSFYVEQLDPMAYRALGATLQVAKTTDVRGGDNIRFAERSQLARTQLLRKGGGKERGGPRRSAAQVRVLDRHERIACCRKKRLHLAAQLL